MASSVNAVVEEYIRWATIVRIRASPIKIKVSTAVRPMATAIGTPSRMNPTRTTKIMRVIIKLAYPCLLDTKPPEPEKVLPNRGATSEARENTKLEIRF